MSGIFDIFDLIFLLLEGILYELINLVFTSFIVFSPKFSEFLVASISFLLAAAFAFTSFVNATGVADAATGVAAAFAAASAASFALFTLPFAFDFFVDNSSNLVFILSKSLNNNFFIASSSLSHSSFFFNIPSFSSFLADNLST